MPRSQKGALIIEIELRVSLSCPRVEERREISLRKVSLVRGKLISLTKEDAACYIGKEKWCESKEACLYMGKP